MNLPLTPEFDFCIDLKVCLNFDFAHYEDINATSEPLNCIFQWVLLDLGCYCQQSFRFQKNVINTYLNDEYFTWNAVNFPA